MDVDLNHIYGLLLKAVRNCPDSVVDKADLARESREASAELTRDIELFRDAWADFSTKLECGDADEQSLSLVVVRGHAMNLETLFRNLAKSVESVVIALRPLKEQS